MVNVTPTELARLFHLSPGIDVKPVNILSYEVFSSPTFLIPFTAVLKVSDPTVYYPLWAEFASIYLPCLFRTFAAYDTKGKGFQYLAVYSEYANVLDACFGVHAGIRIVRELPEECVDAYDHFLDVLEDLFDSGFLSNVEGKERTVNVNTLNGFFNFLDTFTATLAVQYPSASGLPQVTSSTRTKVGSLWKQSLRDLSADQLSRAHKGNPTVQRIFVGGIDFLDQRRACLVGGIAWFACEVARPVRKGKLKAGPCVNIVQGEEMDTCGRCKSVRFCSRKHQAFDWKEHKQVCFAPRW